MEIVSRKMIIVLGSNGMLGRYVYDYLKYKCEYKVVGITRGNLSASNLDDVRKGMNYLIKCGDIVINCMGVTNKRTDISTEEMYIVNAIFPHVLDRICMRKGAHLVHPSTDCVFTGERGNYALSDIKDEEGSYGLSKSIGEEIYGSVVRTSIIGEEELRKSNLIAWCHSQRNCTVNGYVDHFWNGVTCLEWVKLVERIIRERDFWSGVRVYQSTFEGQKSVTKFDLVQCISDVYNLGLVVLPTTVGIKNDRTLCGEILETDLTDQISDLANYRFIDHPYDWIKLRNANTHNRVMFTSLQSGVLPPDIAQNLEKELFSLPDEELDLISDERNHYHVFGNKYSLPPFCESLWCYLNSEAFILQLGWPRASICVTDETRTWFSIRQVQDSGDHITESNERIVSPFNSRTKFFVVLIVFTEEEGGEIETVNQDQDIEQIPLVNNSIIILPCREVCEYRINKVAQGKSIIFSVAYLT